MIEKLTFDIVGIVKRMPSDQKKIDVYKLKSTCEDFS